MLLALCVIFTLSMFSSADVYAAQYLKKPTNVTWSSDDFGIATWDEVDGAVKYRVYINDYYLTFFTNKADLTPYLEFGKVNHYSVQGKVAKNSKKYLDSYFTKSTDLDLTEGSKLYKKYHNGSCQDPIHENKNSSNSCSSSSNTWVGSRYFGANGQMLVGWHKVNGYWYYFGSDGIYLRNTSVKSANGLYDYYLDKNGHWLTNRWQSNKYGIYYVGSDKVATLSEIQGDGGDLYFVDQNGFVVVNQWIYYNDTWNYFLSNGKKCKFIANYGDHSYAFNSDGTLVSSR